MADSTKTAKTVQVQTKVTPEVYAHIESLCKTYGFSIFKMLQMFLDVSVRFMDDQHNLDYDLVRAIRMVEDLPGWKKSICLASDNQEVGIVEAFYVLRAKGMDGYRLALVERPMMEGDPDGWTCTYNIQRMLERFIELVNPILYRHLRQLAVEMGTESMFDMIHTLADNYKENPDEAELRVQFENNNWHQGARDFTSTIHYKRHHSPKMDSMEGQQKIFDNEENDNQ